MAEQNVPTQPPTRTDEQIVPRSQWLTIGKSNLLFNAQKIQKNPIFQISVDILSNTNFFQAFTASANVPAIYLQQFWNTMKYNEKTGVYSCQVDEQWFDLSADLLRKALAITPVNPTHPFELPPSGNTVIDFVNELGSDFFSHKQAQSQSKNPQRRKVTLFSSLWSVFQSDNLLLASNTHPSTSDSVFHHTGDDYILGISSLALKYLKMVAENTKKTPQESESVKPATKSATPKKPTTTTPKGESLLSNCDEEDEAQQNLSQEKDDDPDLDLAKNLSLLGVIQTHFLIRPTLDPSSQLEDDTSEKVITESSSTSDSECNNPEKDHESFVKNHESDQESEDDDDDEGPQPGSNRVGNKEKKGSESPLGWFSSTSLKIDDQSQEKPRELVHLLPNNIALNFTGDGRSLTQEMLTTGKEEAMQADLEGIVWETCSSGLKVIKQRSTLNVLIGMQPTITSKKTIRSSLSQEQLSTETEMIKESDEDEYGASQI
ncbi:hypothetical protein Tco_0108768 [Tanacetum coccineum]